MSDRSFFDTNVHVYTDDRATPSKRRRAPEVMAAHRRSKTGVVSLQVLQEYFVAVARKLHVDAAAIDLHRLHGISFWAALVVRPAKEAGCSVLPSEGFQHGREIERIKITNPFR